MEESDLLKILETHLAEGESQEIEFKEKIPESIRELATNIASFATSNSGTIYLGIDNSGNVIGLENLESPSEKDEFQLRIIGIAKTVNPSIRVSIEFFKKDDKTVAKIIVPKGFKPIYFVGGIPYLRDLSSSRKAEPSEVEELHYKVYQSQGILKEASPEQDFLNNIVVNLADCKLALSDMNEHYVNPYLEQLKYDLGSRGQEIFDASADPIAVEFGLNNELKDLGTKLVEIENYQLYLGQESWKKFLALGEEGAKIVDNSLEKIEKILKKDEGNIPDFIQTVEYEKNKLKNDWEKAQGYKFGSEFDQWRDELRIFAYDFHRYAFLLDSQKYKDQYLKLIELSTKLRMLTTPKIFGFGATGYNPIDSMKDQMNECLSLAEEIPKMFSK